MGDKDDLWNDIVRRHDLRENSMSVLANWPYADWVMARSWDTILEDTKRFRYGFCEVLDSEEMFIDYFDHLRDNRIVP